MKPLPALARGLDFCLAAEGAQPAILISMHLSSFQSVSTNTDLNVTCQTNSSVRLEFAFLVAVSLLCFGK